MAIIGQEINSGMFMWDGKERIFSQWVSSLGALERNLFSRLYDDACDVGFVMISKITGLAAAFYMEEEHRNRDNDITHWTFKPTPEALRKFPQLKGVTGIVWND